ncbi:MAG TPA: hypothetical protein VGV85_13125, partial [Longimicrobiaceae bacterium]|nr:hypothetical protein [Longimicrobiaceae bacterium]
IGVVGEGLTVWGDDPAVFAGDDLVLLSDSTPVVHLFRDGVRERAWGRIGSGPAGLQVPFAVAVDGGRVLVADAQARKIVSFDTAGRVLAVRPTPFRIRRLQVAGRDTLVVPLEFGVGAERVLRLRGERTDTLLSVGIRRIRLAAPGSPSLTLYPPFAPVPLVAGLADGRVAFWDGRGPDVRVLDRQGGTVRRLALPRERLPVTAAERAAWFETRIPRGPPGRADIFGILRDRARIEVRFPTHHPPASALLPDPGVGVWVQRAPETGGALWSWLGPAGERARLRLPPRARLLAVGRTAVAVEVRSADGERRVELLRKPRTGLAARLREVWHSIRAPR